MVWNAQVAQQLDCCVGASPSMWFFIGIFFSPLKNGTYFLFQTDSRDDFTRKREQTDNPTISRHKDVSIAYF